MRPDILQSISINSIRFCGVLLLFLTFSHQESDAQSRTRFLKWMYQDVAGFATSIDHNSALFAVGTTASLIAVAPADPRILHGVQRRYDGSFAGYLNTTNRLGDPEVRIPLFSILAISLVTDNARFQDAAFTSAESWLYAGLITMGLKSAFGRARPESGYTSQTFEPFSGNTSFPSGHTTAAFAIVTPWVMYYPGVATYGLFALSAGTAFARIALDKHWPTDVVAGAAVGYFTARYLSRRHMNANSPTRPRINVSPELQTRAVGLSVRYRIGGE